MSTEARIMLAADVDFEARLRAIMPELNGNVTRWVAPLPDGRDAASTQELLSRSPELLAFGPGLPIDAVLYAAGELDRSAALLEMLVVAEPSPALWEAAARAGIREVVSPDADDDALADAFRRTMALVESRRSRASDPRGPGSPDDAAPPASLALARPARTVTVVRSPKGGSGKTMVASNLAVGLAEAHPGQVAIVDLDLQFGDTATALGLNPSYTIADAAANAELAPTSLKALLSTHSSGVHVLCAPTHPAEADDFTADDVTAVLGLLEQAFPHVVVDTAGGLDETTLAALESATDVLLVCSRDVSSVRALRKELDALDAAGITGPRRHVILNRSDSKVGLEVGDIEDTIGARVDVHVPSSRAVPLHMNCGVPILLAEPASAVARQLRTVLALVDARPTPVGRRRRLWGRR